MSIGNADTGMPMGGMRRTRGTGLSRAEYFEANALSCESSSRSRQSRGVYWTQGEEEPAYASFRIRIAYTGEGDYSLLEDR